MIVADTSAVIALMHAADRHHAAIRTVFEASGSQWVLPWAILPEVDYILATRAGRHVQRLWLDDLAEGSFAVGWGTDLDLARARQIDQQFADLGLGLVDATVLAYAERNHASAIVTLDRRHFGPVTLQMPMALLPDG